MERAHEGRRSVNELDAGDRLETLMQDYKRPLYNFLLVLTRNHDLALECTQETFVRAYENLRRNRAVNTQWLYKVARNRAVDEFRRHKREQSNLEILEDLPDMAGSGESVRVRRALDQLSPDEREILYLFVFDRFKTADIAQMLGIGPGAARMRISRARERFRLAYGDAL